MNGRSFLRLAAVAACAAVVGGCSGAGAGPAGPQAEIAQARGDLVVANSRSGQAIFRAQGLAPGDARSGEVRLTNGGALPGELTLIQADVRDRPGRGGGLLSDKVLLAVRDVTNPADPITVFSGPLGVLDDRRLGAIAPGARRSYRFTVRLPDGGPPPGPRTGDNAYLGSALTVRYVWRATAADRPLTPAPGAPRLSFSVRTRKLIKRGRLFVVVRCDRPCRVSAQARLPKLRRGGKRLRTRRRATTLTTTTRAKVIRLKVSRKTRRRLKARLAKRRKLRLRVTVVATATNGGAQVKRTRRVTIRRRPARAGSPGRARAR
jgi:hypothetical protein